jgi:hypothetical protein
MKCLAIRARAAAASLTFVGLLAPAALAQQPQHSGVRLPNSTQSMIEGTWHAVLNKNNTASLGAITNFACTFSIAADGTITPTNCTLLPGMTFIELPSGKLTINKACHVTGAMSYNTCFFPDQCGISVQLSISAWRSADGSRLTGFQQWQCPYDYNIGGSVGSVACLSNFELVAGQ